MNARTYSLGEVADVYLPPEWTDGVRWLARRLNAGEISGYKVGRVWRMTDADVDEFVAGRRKPTKSSADVAVSRPSTAAVSILDGLSARSRRRVSRVG